jgi:hypothetical protein
MTVREEILRWFLRLLNLRVREASTWARKVPGSRDLRRYAQKLEQAQGSGVITGGAVRKRVLDVAGDTAPIHVDVIGSGDAHASKFASTCPIEPSTLGSSSKTSTRWGSREPLAGIEPGLPPGVEVHVAYDRTALTRARRRRRMDPI